MERLADIMERMMERMINKMAIIERERCKD
jgi:hypothetical protein